MGCQGWQARKGGGGGGGMVGLQWPYTRYDDDDDDFIKTEFLNTHKPSPHTCLHCRQTVQILKHEAPPPPTVRQRGGVCNTRCIQLACNPLRCARRPCSKYCQPPPSLSLPLPLPLPLLLKSNMNDTPAPPLPPSLGPPRSIRMGGLCPNYVIWTAVKEEACITVSRPCIIGCSSGSHARTRTLDRWSRWWTPPPPPPPSPTACP